MAGAMSGEDQGLAKPLFDQGLEQDGPQPPNAFTPISVSERLRQPPRRRDSYAQGSLPPLRPGQRYGYGTPDAREAEGPGVPLSRPAPPSFAAPLELQAEDLLQYQQDYWFQLQGHGNREAPAREEPSFPLPPASVYEGERPAPPSPPRTLWDEDFLEPTPEEGPDPWDPYPWELAPREPDPWEAQVPEVWEPQDMGYVPLGESAPREPPLWDPQEQWAAEPPFYPKSIPEIMPPAAPGPAWRRWLHRAFPMDGNPEMTKERLFHTVLAGILSLALAFCLLQVGRLVLGLLRNQEEMKAVREEYYALAGVELAREASRVELLPPGETYTPTAAPPAVETPPPAPGADPVLAASGQEAPAIPRQGDNPEPGQRTKLTQYPHNPLNNVLEAFRLPRQENPDIVGRLFLEGLVDETVVLRNNTYYLTHSANGAFSETGAVFVDEACGLRSPPENLLLRGQSTAPGKLLEPLWQYATQGPEFVRQHGLLRMDTLYEEGEYVVFAVIVTSNQAASPQYFNYAGYPSFPSDSQMESYVAAAKQRSLYEIPVEVAATDRLLTLSTLGAPDGATLVLMARRLRQGESAASLLRALGSIRVK